MDEVKSLTIPLSEFLQKYISITEQHSKEVQVSMCCTSVLSILASHVTINQCCPYELSAYLIKALEHYLDQQDDIEVM